ncbi:MAG: hypothetical protein QNJ47_28325 [Nostocaceae cyanobacterium]|nr:hypothetical protein [Nostocaceae cyanobacterium]
MNLSSAKRSSGIVMAKSSENTYTASAKSIPCLRRFLAFQTIPRFYLNAIALKRMLFFSLYTKAETPIFTFVPKSLWFTETE